MDVKKNLSEYLDFRKYLSRDTFMTLPIIILMFVNRTTHLSSSKIRLAFVNTFLIFLFFPYSSQSFIFFSSSSTSGSYVSRCHTHLLFHLSLERPYKGNTLSSMSTVHSSPSRITFHPSKRITSRTHTQTRMTHTRIYANATIFQAINHNSIIYWKWKFLALSHLHFHPCGFNAVRR